MRAVGGGPGGGVCAVVPGGMGELAVVEWYRASAEYGGEVLRSGAGSSLVVRGWVCGRLRASARRSSGG